MQVFGKFIFAIYKKLCLYLIFHLCVVFFLRFGKSVIFYCVQFIRYQCSLRAAHTAIERVLVGARSSAHNKTVHYRYAQSDRPVEWRSLHGGDRKRVGREKEEVKALLGTSSYNRVGQIVKVLSDKHHFAHNCRNFKTTQSGQ
jgi:hypothetical protein